ncbi:hypothetical protein Tco_0951626 [Tanacetum coccineum]|uniref:Uncharacterized protein n=1 Tax=Tanacetum coccineum TaxID=301880 RepID=A0ABQ5DUP7_9ASTR
MLLGLCKIANMAYYKGYGEWEMVGVSCRGVLERWVLKEKKEKDTGFFHSSELSHCLKIFVASYGTVLASCQHSTLCVRKYCVSELSSCAGSELGSELTLLAGSELKTSELDTSELKTSEYRFLKIFILASYEQELCQFNFLLASCQLSSSELHIASYRLIEDNFSSDL